MKNSIQKLQVTIAVLCLLVISAACTQDSEVGPIGPQGPQGEQGIQGEQGEPGQDGEDGADGADGQDGEDGNSNVIASEWVDSTFRDEIASSADQIVFDSNITESVLNNHVILGYVKAGSRVFQLPYTTQGRNIRFLYILQEGNISFRGRSVDGTPQNFAIIDAFRYVIIPPNSSSGRSSKESILNELKSAGVDFNDYEQVADYFGLED